MLKIQPEPEAQGLALSSELFITGTLNTFARHTNVDTQARIIAYDIRELGEQLMPLGMLVTLDAIYNRVIQNWKKGRRTWIFCDEFTFCSAMSTVQTFSTNCGNASASTTDL